MRYYIRMQNH